jgi:eukaryotic-like serine/threonine-protein kinase
MTESVTPCPRCGRPLPSGHAGGNCAACLFDSVLGNEPLPLPPEDGEVLLELGDYEILNEIGRGGTGVVYRARQRSLNRIVALKTLHGGAVNSRDAYERLKVEANAVARLDHPHIVSLFEIGRHSGTHFLALRYFEHGSLADAVSRRRFTPSEAVRLISDAARAVHHAHTRGVLHRDLKPSNLLLDERGVPHVADFGLAKLADSDTSLTLSTSVLGTPAYMAPEQASGHAKEAGTPADVYSLGAILFELLAGRPPFTGRSALEVLRQVADTEPPSPRSINPAVDRDLEAICLRCLEKDPSRRYASASALADDLERWARHETLSIRPATPAERATKWVRRRPLLAGALAAVATTFLAGLVATTIQWRRAEQERETTARRGYVASLSMAERRLSEGDVQGARTLLIEQPERYRGWEWGRLMAMAHSELLAIPIMTHRGNDRSLDFLHMTLSEDARWAACGNGGVLEVVDVERREKVFEVGSKTNRVGISEFSPDGQWLAGAGPGPGYTIWSTRDWKPARRFGEKDNSKSIRFSPDGTRVVTATHEGQVRVWDAATGALLFDVAPTTSKVEDVRFTLDGTRLLSVLWNERTRESFSVWNAADGELLETVPEEPLDFRYVSITGDGSRYSTLDWNGKAAAWRVGEPRPYFESPAEGETIAAAELSLDGRRLMTVRSENAELRFWDTEKGLPLPAAPGRAHFGTPFGDGSLLVTAAGEQLVLVWDWETGRADLKLGTGRNASFAVPYSTHDRRHVAAVILPFHGQPSLHVWALPQRDRQLQPRYPVARGALSPDGRILALGHMASQVSLTDAETGRRIGYLDDHHLWVTALAWTSDSKTLFTASADHTVRRWSLPSGRLETVFRDLDRPLWSLAVSRDGKVLAASDTRGRIGVWDGASGAFRLNIGSTPHFSTGLLAMDPQGSWIAKVACETPGVWSTRDGSALFQFDASGAPEDRRAIAVAVSAKGDRLATLDVDGRLRIWETGSWKLLRENRGRRGAAAMAFSPDGSRLFIGSSDSNLAWIGNTGVDVHDGLNGDLLVAFADCRGWAPSIGVSQDGRRLFRTVMDNAIRVHGADIWDAFPWRDADYPGARGEPLAERIRNFAHQAERRRLASIRSAPASVPERLLPEPRHHWAARSPGTPVECVDLTAVYNGHLETAWYPFDVFESYDEDLRDLPRGVVRLDGQTWDIRGMIVTGFHHDIAFSAFRANRSVDGIPVGRTCRRLHFLHAAVHTLLHERISGFYRLHYADGSTARLELVSGEDIGDSDAAHRLSRCSRGSVAWEGGFQVAGRPPSRVRLFHRAFDNPHPEKEIVSMDLVAEGGGVKPFLVALTVE